MPLNARHLAATTACIAVSSAFAPEALSQEAVSEPENVMVVLDASGSMWGQVDGRTKIEIVRDAIGDLLESWQEKPINAGLIAYGHRRKGDCSDIEMLSSPAPVDAATLRQTVNGLNPKGKTPLGDAVRMAAEELKFKEEAATVVLPCALGSELESLGIDFTAHVIGFDLQSDEQDQLACLAENTGGQFISASNAEELNEAMAQTVSAVEENSSPATKPASDLGQGMLVPVLADNQEPAGTTVWTILTPDGEVIVETDSGGLEAAAIEEKGIVPGTYDIHARYKSFSGAAHITYPLDEDTDFLLKRDAPETELVVQGPVVANSEFKVEWTGSGAKDDAVAIVPSGQSAAGENVLSRSSLSGSTATLTAPEEGKYDLIYIHDAYGLRRVDARQSLTVDPVKFRLSPVGDLWAGEDFIVNWSGPGAKGDMIAIGPRGTGKSDYTSLDWIEGDAPVELTAPDEPGEYEIRYYAKNYKLLFAQPVIVE